MPDLIHIRRHHSSVPFGFKLQGGHDFSIPLSILEVTPNSIAEQVGLRPGDAILKINNVETSWMDHNRGKQEIVNAGDEFYLEVQRNAVNNSYQPQARPLSALLPTIGKSYQKSQQVYPVPHPIKTDLTVDKGPTINIGTSHNRAPMPFNRNVGTSMVYQAQKPTNWTPGDYTHLNEPSYNENTMNHSKSQQFYPPQQQNYHQQQPQYNYPPHQPNQYNPVQEQNSFRNNSSGQFNDPMKASLMAEIRNQTKVNTSHTELIKKGIQKPATPPSYQTTSNQTYNFGPSQAQPLRSSAQPRTSGSLSMRMLNKDLQTVEGTRQQASSIFDLKNGNPTGATVPRGFRSVMAPVELPPEQRHAPIRKEYQVQHVKSNWIEPRMN